MGLIVTISLTAVRTARRNLVQRIDGFVKRIQIKGLQTRPDALAKWAMECLERADNPGAENVMIWGEYGFRPRFPRRAGHRRLVGLSSALNGRAED